LRAVVMRPRKTTGNAWFSKNPTFLSFDQRQAAEKMDKVGNNVIYANETQERETLEACCRS